MRKLISINKNVWANLCMERDWECLMPLEFQPITKFVTFFNTYCAKQKRLVEEENALKRQVDETDG